MRCRSRMRSLILRQSLNKFRQRPAVLRFLLRPPPQTRGYFKEHINWHETEEFAEMNHASEGQQAREVAEWSSSPHSKCGIHASSGLDGDAFRNGVSIGQTVGRSLMARKSDL